MSGKSERKSVLDFLRHGSSADNGQREVCESCGEPYAIGDYPFCPHGQVERGYSTPFKTFSQDLGTSRVEVSSLHGMRKLERESEKRAGDAAARYADGGKAPTSEERQLVFREHSQDRSNRAENVFGKREQPRPITRSKNGIPFVTGGGIVGPGELD